MLKVSREYLDGVTGDRLAEREEFVEALSHDCWVAQVPLLAARRRRTDLHRLLSVFDQEFRCPATRALLEVDERQLLAVSARSLVDGNAAIWSAMIPGLG